MLKKTGLFVVILSFLALLEPRSSQAQEIKVDGSTATIVTKDGDRITIDGNTFSRDGKNLFHSFKEFGLTQQQIATFLTNPNIHNILTRVTGGNPSYINGLIQVVGGNSNLFLMNPAGVVFGSGASINVPADFTATTATGIGFNNGVFSAVGSNDYSNLTGNPTNFVFNTNQPGSIINAGDLKVSEGSNINLIGGNVINTGSIETPNGKINIQAVAGTSRVKITPEGSLLSLELDIPKDEQGNLLSFTPQDLPTLLTGAHNAGVATPNVTVNNNQVQVANVNIPEGTGSSIVSGKVSTSSETLGGEITVLGEKVGVIEGEITANGGQGGGKVLIGGDREGKGTIPNAEVTYISPDSKISADATVNGDGGQVIVFAQDYANIHGELTAKGGSVSGDGGFIETSGKTSFNITSIPDTSAVSGQAGEWLIDPLNVTIVSGFGDIGGIIDDDGDGVFIPPGSFSNTVGVDNLKSGLFVNNTVTVTTQAVGTEEGNITWNSDATLDYDGIRTGKTLVLKADRDIVYRGIIQDSNPDVLSPDSLNVTFNSNASDNGGSILIGGDLTLGGDITTGGGNIILGGGSDPLSNPAVGGNTGGDVLLNNGIVIYGNLLAEGGDISITGQGFGTTDAGVGLFGRSAVVVTTGAGNITLRGTSGGGIDIGIASSGIIQAENGNINLVSINDLSVSSAIRLGGTVKTTGSGSIIIDGQAPTGRGVLFSTFYDPRIITEGSGNIEIRGSSLELDLDINPSFGSANTTISTLGTGSIIFNLENEVNLGNALTPNGSIPINSAKDLSITGSSIRQTLGIPITVVGTTTLNSFVLNGGSIEPRDITLTGNNNFNNLVITNGQNVTINDINDINLGNLNVTGDFTLTSGGNITANQGLVLNSGNINLTALGNISTPSNNINLTSSGTIDLSANQILTDGGNLTLNAVGNINTPIINTGAIADNGGNVNITSSTGNIQTGNIFTNNSSGSLGDSGSVTLSAIQGSLNVGDIDITNFSLADTPSNAAIDLNALSTINTGAITLGNDNDNTLSSGNVTIETPSVVTVNGNINSNGSDIVIGTATPSEVNINGSVNSNGGDITINSTGLIKIDSGTIEPTSISSGSGNIVLNHGGGDLNPRVPFTVGDANINGTSGSIVTATESIIPTETYPNSFVTPNRTIQINTTDLIDLPIVAATLDIDNDNTGSIVSSSDGLLIDITGGTLSGNGSNLFHSFTRFDLPQSNQTANFVTETSGINNILARIISGEASLINGRIQVSGLSNPNLFLMNPAGIVFGQTATINVPNAFIATTATGISFGDNWFSANGDYNASLLNVDPINLAFTANTSGAIINTSSLNNTNGSVSLLGGTQINTDNLTNNNTLNLSAIQGQNILDLTTFSVTPASESATLPNEFIPPILTLEELVNTALAKGSGNLGITVLGSNSLQVDSNNTIVNLGDIATQNISASNTNIVATNNVTLGTFGDTIADNSNSLNVNANGQLQLLGTLEPKGGDVSIVGVNNFISPNNINTGGGNFTLNSIGDVAINNAITTTGGDIEITGNNISSGNGVVLPFNTANDAGNGGNINLSSLNGNVNVNGLSSESSVGNGGNISISANLGDINIGNVNSLSGGNLSLTATGNISNTEGLTVGGSTLLSAGNNITLDNSNNDFQSLSIQNGNNVTLADVNDLTLANIDALGNPILVEISGNLDLRVTGTTNINSNIQANSILTDSSGSTVINGDTITTTLNQTYNDSVILAKDTVITGNNITFGSSIDSQTTPQSLTINGVSELGSVGSVNALSQLTTQQTTLTGNVKTTGNQNYNDAVTLASDVQLDGNNIIFGSSIDGSQSLTVNSIGEGETTFNGEVGSATPLTNLTTNADGTTKLNADVTTSGSQEYNDAVTLNNNIILTTTNSSIDFANTVNSAMATNNDLTVNTGSKNITFNNSIGDTQSLGDVKLNSTRVTTLNTVNANSLTTNEGGTTQLNDNVNTAGSQEYNDAVTLNNNITLTTTNSSIDFANTVRGVDQNLTANTGSGNITFNSSVGTNELKLGDIVLNSTGTTALNTLNANSLTTDEGGTTQLNGNVTTTGIQNYQNNVEIGNPITLTTTNSNIIFDGTVNSESGETNNLTLRNGTGNIAFNQDVGNTQSLGNIRINTIGNTALNNVKVNTLITNAEGKTILNGNVTTIGVQNYQDNVEIGNSVTLTTTDSNISFQGTVNSILEETNNLLLNTGNANITFNQAIGNTQPLGDIIANSTRITRFNNDVNANSLTTDEGGTSRLNGNVTSSGDQVYNDNVFLEKTIILDTNNLTAVSIEANRTSANPISLTINALDSVTITGKPDANSLLAISTARTNNQETGNITINANNDINLQGAVNTTATSAASLATIAGDISLASENGDVSVLAIASIGTETSGNVIISGNNIDTGVILTFLNPTNVTTGNINIQGNSTTVSGTIQGLSLTTSGTFTLAENPSILALPNRALASLGNATVNTINNQNYNNFNLLNNAALNSIQGEISFTGGVNGNDKNVSITAQNINSENITSQGGNISLTSTNGGITTENLNTSGTTGGSIELNSNTTINTADIQTTSSNGNGGDVILNANNDIEVTSINTSSNNGQGGDVNISTLGRLRVTDTIDNTDISINATGTNGGGAITIDFFPDNSQTGKTEDPRLPFVVGNPSSNGTQGIITNGEFSISPDQYFEVVQEGNIDVILLNPLDPRDRKLGELKKDGDMSNSVAVPPESPPQIATVLPSIIPITTISQGQEILTQIEQQIAEKPAFIYVSFTPKGFQPRDLDAEFARREATNTQEYSRVNINQPNLQPTIALKPAEDDQLDLLVITSKGEPIRVTVPVTRQQVVDSALNLSIELSSDNLDDKYKPYAKELYSWLITPIEETLKERKISNLLFILPLNIRFVPIASLYDEKTEKFLVEKYSSGLAPSLNLNDNTYRSVKDLNLLAMGAAEFAEDQQQTPLPGVKLELPTIKTVWNEQSPDNYQEFLNNNFTLETIQANLDKQPYGIIHFGTHGSFGADENEDIFIQLYNSRLNFKDIGSLGLSRSNVELMLLSACQTALGNDIAELGFAGLAVQAGVKSAIGTVWTIGDTGTLAFMTDFYGELKTQTTKAEALRQTQLNMLNGKVRKSEDGNSIITPNRSVSLEGLPEDSRQREDFSHPFYWAPFTLIGNPW